MIRMFLSSCVDRGIINSFDLTSNNIMIKSKKENLMVALKQNGFFMFSTAIPNKGKEIFSNNRDVVLNRVLATHVLGTTDAEFQGKSYHGVSVYPSRVLNSAVEFSTASGNKFICNSSNTRITLGLYDLLYSLGGEHSILMMPELNNTEDVVKLASSYTVGLRNEYLNSSLITSAANHVALPTEKAVRVEQNCFLYQNDYKGNNTVTVDQAIRQSHKIKLTSGDRGYTVESSAVINGINYDFSGEALFPLEVVRDALNHAGGDVYHLQSGFTFDSASAKQFADHGNSFKNTLFLKSNLSFESKKVWGAEANKTAAAWLPGCTSFNEVERTIIDY